MSYLNAGYSFSENNKSMIGAPVRAYETDSGWDVFSIGSYTIKKNEIKKINTGIHIEIPDPLIFKILRFLRLLPVYVEVTVRPKSSSNANGKPALLGTVDFSYTGELIVILHNISNASVKINVNDKVAQICFTPVLTGKGFGMEYRSKIKERTRGSNGFGSTGVR